MYIYLYEKMLIIKTKRLIILVLLASNIHKNFFILLLMSSLPVLRENFLFYIESIVILKCGENFLFFQTLQFPSWNIRNFIFRKNVRKFFKLRARNLHFMKYKKTFFWKNIRKFHYPKYKKNSFQSRIF